MTGPKEKDHNDNSTREFEGIVRRMYEGDEEKKEEDEKDEQEE